MAGRPLALTPRASEWEAMGGLVPCVECETNPLTPGDFCECCGRRLSAVERNAVGSNPAPAAAVVEVSPPAVSGGPCESCGGPSTDGPLCQSCESAFQSIIASTSAPLAPEITHHVEQWAPGTVDTTPTASAPESESPEATVLPVEEGEPTGESSNTEWSTINSVEIDAPTHEPHAVEAEPTHGEAGCPTETALNTAHLEIASSPEAQFARAEAGCVEAAATEPESVRVNENPAGSAQQSTGQWMGLAAAAVMAVAVMGVPLGVWLGTRHQAEPEPRQTAVPGVQKTAVAPAAVSVASAPTKAGELPLKAQAVAEARPKTRASRVPPAKATPAKAARKLGTAPRAIAPQPVPVQAVPGLATLQASPIVEPPPLVEPPRIVAPTPPAGRLFEPADVDESPRVATRVEPQLPDDLAKRFPQDVVIVRVLVSPSGHPFRVSLLRRSRGGRSLDDAVVAAVSQWTFSPARKRGEAVSCWMNFGVPIGR